MSDAALESALLSQEELDAIFAALGDARAEEDARPAAVARPSRDARRDPAAWRERAGALRRAIEDFATSWSRQLSLTHQRRITAHVLGCEPLRVREVSEILLPVDRLVSFELEPDGPVGYLLLGRVLFFQLLSLACGSRPDAPAAPVPRRPYTALEQRFLRRFASELVNRLGRSWVRLVSGPPRVLGVHGAEGLRDAADDDCFVASVDVSGLGDAGRLRVIVPRSPFAAGEGPEATHAHPDVRERIAQQVLEMPVSLRVEIGTAQISLAQVAGLRPGALIPLQRSDADGLVVRLEGAAKFRAQRGAMGRVLAIQVGDRI